MQAHRFAKGFTLIETVLVIVVLGIAAAAVLALFTESMRGSGNPAVVTQALELAQGELEQVIADKRANGFNAIATGTAGCTIGLPSCFACSRSVQYVDASDLNTAVAGPTNYKRVAVTVTAPDNSQLTVVTLLSNH